MQPVAFIYLCGAPVRLVRPSASSARAAATSGRRRSSRAHVALMARRWSAAERATPTSGRLYPVSSLRLQIEFRVRRDKAAKLQSGRDETELSERSSAQLTQRALARCQSKRISLCVLSELSSALGLRARCDCGKV